MSTVLEQEKALKGAEIDRLCANTIRMLAADAVQKANSGHPGMPMGCADFAYVLWTKFLKVDPKNPSWPDRDRFILSAGHGSMLLYSLLHLSGFDVSLDEIKNFRQLGSITPGHPEFGETPGVECTSGPLGQGIANSVGMAIAETWLGATFNDSETDLVDHNTYVLCGDGDLEEGISSEACSLAGHLGLGKITVFYDDNQITIDGATDLAFSEDVRMRFESYGWHVQAIDGHDHEAIALALESARAEGTKPSLIMGRTKIAYGSPAKEGTSASHGAPLGEEEIRATKRHLGMPEDKTFYVPDEVREQFAIVGERGGATREDWNGRLARLKERDSAKADQWQRCVEGALPENLTEVLPTYEGGTSVATRKSSGQALESLMGEVPNIIGGSADLAGSNCVGFPEYNSYSKQDRSGRQLNFGIREHAMGAILNGLCYHGGVRPFGATFLVFSDYMRPAIRLAALSKLNPIYVFTHDSIFVGEDGPTHQPVEHLAALRCIPNVTVIRPAHAVESSVAWEAAMQNKTGPTALCLTRQGLPIPAQEDQNKARGLLKGAYCAEGKEGLTLLASGSEVSLAAEVRALLAAKDIRSRVVSMPSWELFEAQDEAYRSSVLGDGPRVAIEAGVAQGWDRYVGDRGLIVCMESFGASAPGGVVAKHFGFDAEAIVENRILPWLASIT